MMDYIQRKWIQAEGNINARICASFKQEAIHKEVKKLRDEEGVIRSKWEEIAEIPRQHFLWN